MTKVLFYIQIDDGFIQDANRNYYALIENSYKEALDTETYYYDEKLKKGTLADYEALLISRSFLKIAKTIFNREDVIGKYPHELNF